MYSLRRLAGRPYIAGDYSIADIAIFPWMRYGDRRGVNVEEYPNVKRWFDSIDARPAVKRGLEVLNEKSRNAPMDDKQKEILFGATQYAKR
jgi:GST-like protein